MQIVATHRERRREDGSLSIEAILLLGDQEHILERNCATRRIAQQIADEELRLIRRLVLARLRQLHTDRSPIVGHAGTAPTVTPGDPTYAGRGGRYHTPPHDPRAPRATVSPPSTHQLPTTPPEANEVSGALINNPCTRCGILQKHHDISGGCHGWTNTPQSPLVLPVPQGTKSNGKLPHSPRLNTISAADL